MRLLGLALATALLITATADAQAYQLPAGQVAAYPSPGTLSASPTTSFSFRGVNRAGLGEVTVRGSRSGSHRGRLVEHSDGQGVSWVPGRRFRQGERVTVRTKLPIVNARGGDFRVRIGTFPHVRVQTPDPRRLPAGPLKDFLLGENIPPGRLHRFRSRPDLTPPVVTMNKPSKPTAPGYIFLSPKSKKDLKQAGPMIVDDAGKLVYFRPLPGIRAATDFRAQTYQGKPVLTYWDGTSRLGIGTGELVILDQRYKEIKRIKAPNGLRPDLHEFVITPRDTAILISYPIVRTDTRRVGGVRNGLTVDSVIQEVDIATGQVVFEWHSLGRIALREAMSPAAKSSTQPFDYVHANSVNLDTDGNFLMSGRTTWAVYKIDRASGRILWRLGGKRSTYKLGRGVRFAWQHDAHRRADGAITLFDNSAFPAVRKRSRALAIRLDDQRKTATLISARTHPRGLLAATQGNAQNLPNGNIMVGWGSQRWFSEHDARGNVLLTGRVSLGFESYRTYRMPWVGLPATRPRAAARRASNGWMHVYASWNGATQVAAWEVLGGSKANALRPLTTEPRTNFETRIELGERTSHVAVRARDAAGNVLATSPTTRLR